MNAGIGSRSYPIVLFDDDLEIPTKISSGTKVSPIVLSSDDEEEFEDALHVAAQQPNQDLRAATGKRYMGDSPDQYSFNGTGVAYDIMLSMGYLPGKGLGSQMKGDITPIPVSLRKRKRGVGFESTSASSSPEPQFASTSYPSPDPPLATHTTKKPKSVSPQGEMEAPYGLGHAPSQSTQSTSTLPTFPDPSPSTKPVANQMDMGFEEYVSTLSGFAMAAMPTAMQAAVAAHPMTAFQIAQSYFNPNFHLSPPPLLPSMPPFHLGQSPSAVAPGSASTASMNGSRLLPPAKLPPIPDANAGSRSTELKKCKQDKDVGPQPPAIKNQKACIGWIPQPKFPNRGVFKISPDSKTQTYWGDMHVPNVDCCLVMEDLPNKHRNLSFVKEWGNQFSPRPAFGVVDAWNGKALIEFASRADAVAAYLSPRLQGPKYEKAHHVRVFWYQRLNDRTEPLDAPPTATAPVQPMKKKKRQAEQERGTKDLTKGHRISPGIPTYVAQMGKEEQPTATTSTHFSPMCSQPSHPKDRDSVPRLVSNTTTHVPASVSSVHYPLLDRYSTSSISSAQTAGSTPTPTESRTMAHASRDVLELQNCSESPVVTEPVNEIKAAPTLTSGSLYTPVPITPSATNPHTSVRGVLPSVPPDNLSSVPPTDLLAISPSEPLLRKESLLEQRLRLQLLAKKQLAVLDVALRPREQPASAPASTGTPMDIDTGVAGTPQCEARSPPPQAPECSRQSDNSPSPSPQNDSTENNVQNGDGKVPQLTITASLENLATSFINETLHSAREQAADPVARGAVLRMLTDGPTASSAPTGSAVNLAARQQRLAQQIAESKLLMEKYQMARTKTEKDRIMQLLKEQNRLMGESKPPIEKQVPERAASVTKFCWPQSVDSGIFLVSDDEDDMDEA